MKRKTKITVFIASMALTVGSLIVTLGTRHKYCGLHNNSGACENYSQEDGFESKEGDSMKN